MDSVIPGFTIIAGLSLYFLPTIIATTRALRRLPSIFAVNLIVGWTIVGWIATLLWVLADRHSPRSEHPSPAVENDHWSFDRSQLTDRNDDPSDHWVLGRDGGYIA